MTNNIVRILIDARQLIVNDGWCQGTLYNYKGQRCALGAISDAHIHIGQPPGRYGAITWLRKGTQADSVVQWNDTPGRTVEQVLAAFDRAIELARAAEDPPTP